MGKSSSENDQKQRQSIDPLGSVSFDGTEPGEELPPDLYAQFRENRLAVNRWLSTLGIHNLHCVHPTYDGKGDLFGRDLQFLQDRIFRKRPMRRRVRTPTGFP